MYWIINFMMIEKADEYQLVQFITVFKGLMAFTTGAYGVFSGAVRVAVGIDAVVGCASEGVPYEACDQPLGYPGGWAAFPWEFFCFLCEAVVVWIAFLLLPFSTDAAVGLRVNPLRGGLVVSGSTAASLNGGRAGAESPRVEDLGSARGEAPRASGTPRLDAETARLLVGSSPFGDRQVSCPALFPASSESPAVRRDASPASTGRGTSPHRGASPASAAGARAAAAKGCRKGSVYVPSRPGANRKASRSAPVRWLAGTFAQATGAAMRGWERRQNLRRWVPRSDSLQGEFRTSLYDPKRGGVLRRWFRYELGIAALCACIVLLRLGLLSAHSTAPGLLGIGAFERVRLVTTLYWVRVLYGLLSLPFAVFTLPFFAVALTHARPTGYDEYGKCVRVLTATERYAKLDAERKRRAEAAHAASVDAASEKLARLSSRYGNVSPTHDSIRRSLSGSFLGTRPEMARGASMV